MSNNPYQMPHIQQTHPDTPSHHPDPQTHPKQLSIEG